MENTPSSKRQLELLAPEELSMSKIQTGEAQSAGVAIDNQLTIVEKEQLAALEEVVHGKLADFFAVGSALLEIKTNKLYRETHPSFHVYCQERWDIGRSYANKLIGSAERIKLLPSTLEKPTNEFQVRPFLQLKPSEFPKKWQAVLNKAEGGKITSNLVKDALDLSKKKRKKRKKKTIKQNDDINALLSGIRVALGENNVEEASKLLAKLEEIFRE